MRIKGRTSESIRIAREIIHQVNTEHPWDNRFYHQNNHNLEIYAYKTSGGIRIKVYTKFDLHKVDGSDRIHPNLNESRWFSDNLHNLEGTISGYIGRLTDTAETLYWSYFSKVSLFRLAESIRRSEENKYDDFLDYIDMKSKNLNITDVYTEMDQHTVYIWKDIINQYVEKKNELKNKQV